ncbi:quattro [Xenentodon cancila]
MNPQSLDSSIQSTLSALFPPFEATAPIVISQLFRTIDERYQGDALQCLLDFLIPSKHLLESVQQAACAGYSDVVFRCEGWPLCLHDKTVIHLASVNPLLLRPGDFYLQVEPFGDQAARIVLKSLLEAGCREIEETPIPETSYPCIFTEEWLQDINEGRQGTPLSRCLLCTDQGVIKLPWTKIVTPEFLDKPRVMATCEKAPPESKHISVPFQFNSSTLPVDAVIPPLEDRMSASLRPACSPSRPIKKGHERLTPKSDFKPLIKPVGWVSPNTWESHNYQEIEGDYVDLVDISKGKEFVDKHRDSHDISPKSVLFQSVSTPSHGYLGNSAPYGHNLQSTKESSTPCSQRGLGQELADQDFKSRYRDSYVAALRNPLTFEKGSVNHLSALEEGGVCEEGDLRPGGALEAQGEYEGNACDRCKNSVISNEYCQHKPSCEQTSQNSVGHLRCTSESEFMKESSVILNSTSVSSLSQRVQTKHISHQLGHTACVAPVSHVSMATFDGDLKPNQKAGDLKPSGKQKVKARSLSTVSETPIGSPALYKLNNRSHSDICPETINDLIQRKKSMLVDQETGTLERQKGSKKGVQLPATLPDSEKVQKIQDSGFRRVSSLLELGILCLPGSRDRNGRAVVECHTDRKEWLSPLVSAQSVCELLLYLHSIPRKYVRELGMTLVINARKKPPPLQLYKALLMAQEQALHAVHSIIILMDKDSCQRPEKQPGLQMDVVTSMRVLNKTVEAAQLTSDLGGTFMYGHTDWLQFHRKIVSFKDELQESNSLLQKAIKNMDVRKQTDSVQEVQRSIQEQKVSMKEVLEDARLVTLQREGGTLLARMKREELRFQQSEDYRDALESVTSLYNQVEEKLHTLVMKSNESLQRLEFLLRIRETEAKIATAVMWFSAEGEQRLKLSCTTDDTLQHAEKALQDFNLFLLQSKEKQQQALTLIAAAEEIVGTGSSCPGTDALGTLVSTFKSSVEDFMLRAERRQKELETLVHVCSFCEQIIALAKECSHFSEQVEEGSWSAHALSTLQMYKERLGGEFSTQHFEALRAEVCAVGSAAPGIMRVWNAAWVQSQEVRQRLEEMQKKKGVDKSQIQQTTAANPPGEHGEMEREGKSSEVGEAVSSLTQQHVSHTELFSPAEITGQSSKSPSFKDNLKGRKNQGLKMLQFPEKSVKSPTRTLISAQICDHNTETKWRPREHHSEADLRSASSTTEAKDLPLHQSLGRSLSDGSCVKASSCASSLNTGHKHCHSGSLDQNLQPIQNLHIPQNKTVCQKKQLKGDCDKGKCEGCTVSVQNPEDSKTTQTLITPAESNGSNDLKVKKILEELLSTEREYVKALGYVREHYFPELERADVPQDLRGQRGSIFGNLEKLHDFHCHHFMDELESCVAEPFRVGRCFLRHRESFALYALYSKNKPQSDSLLINHGQVFFKQKQLKLGDKMDLWSYLLKPVQRISKYSLLLQDMMSECGQGQSREVAEIKAALEVVHFQLRHGNNLLAMDAILHCDVNLKEQGQLIRQDEFLVTYRKKKCFRHIFLFQELVLFSKTRRTDVGNDTYIYKQSFKTSDIGITQNSGDSGLCFEIWFRKRKSQDTYTLQAAGRSVKEAWTKDLEQILWEQAIHNREVRMQERVFLGIGNKPFIDIQPSDAAINDRAINYVLMGRENKVLSSVRPCRAQGELQGKRPNSVGSGSSSSSSSSSGRDSLSPVGYVCGPKLKLVSGSLGGYVSPPGAVEEDDLDQESGGQNLLLDSSESSGDSVSGFSSSSHSFQSAVGGEAEDSSSVCTSIITVQDAAISPPTEGPPVTQTPNALAGSAGKTKPPVAPKPKHKSQCQQEDLSSNRVQSTAVGKSTEV